MFLGAADGVWGLKLTPLGFPNALVLPAVGLWGEEVSRTCLGPGSPSPRGPSRHPVALLPSGQACLRPRCYGGCVLVSHQAPGCGRPQPRAGQNPGRLRCPFRQTYPEPAHPTTCFPPWKPTPPAARVVLSLPTPHQPAAPMVPRHPTSRTEPASPTPACPMAQRSPHLFHGQGGIPMPAFPGGHRQTPPDQHPPPPALPPGFPLETSSLGFREVCETQMYLKNTLWSSLNGTNSREEAPSGTRGWEAEPTAGGL